MNGKATVSKELNAKHAKILEGLLKLPENRECADCQNKAPRWASVNLGIFICMRCRNSPKSWSSYIKEFWTKISLDEQDPSKWDYECSTISYTFFFLRSCHIHLSVNHVKHMVRSTTLDTWLPDQISFMQVMGNEKSNKHWEAKMPPNFDRSKLGIEKFILAKYVEKRWSSKDKLQSTSRSAEISYVEDSPNGGARSSILKNNRRLSLEESILANHVAQILPPITRSPGGSIDPQKKKPPPLKRPSSSVDFDKSTGKSNGTGDILLCIYDDPQNFSAVPPSSWATFDCSFE